MANTETQQRAGLEDDVEGVRRALHEVDDDDGPGIPMDEVFDRLEAKFRSLTV
jgi:hypothetical protein